jgi:hypothetical protein
MTCQLVVVATVPGWAIQPRIPLGRPGTTTRSQ